MTVVKNWKMDRNVWGLAICGSMSHSRGRQRRPERRLVQVAAEGTKRDRLGVADECEVHIQTPVGEVADRLDLVQAGDRRERQGQPDPSIVDGRAEPGRPGPGR